MDITIWDREGHPPDNSTKIVLWKDFSDESSHIVSIPSFIEEHAIDIREIYLKWIDDLGKSIFNGKPLIEHLKLRDDFSFWWMTPIFEKCNFSKSPHITDAIKIIAFSKWAELYKINKVYYFGSNKNLANCFELWCSKKNIEFKWNKFYTSRNIISLYYLIYQCLPKSVQALIWFFYRIYQIWPLRNIGVNGWSSSIGNITFISYLFNQNLNSENKGNFNSPYWGNLPNTLLLNEHKTNWLHLYVKDDKHSCSHAATILENYNNSNAGMQNHVALESFISFSVISKVLFDWIHLIILNSKLEKNIIQFNKSETEFYFWPLFSQEWKKSIIGQVSIANIFNYHLFYTALRYLPQQRLGIYLQENQGWEFGFTQIWRNFKHGKLIGFPHTTVKFWDLRYFFYPEILQTDNQDFKLPLPDFVAANGSATRNTLLEGGYTDSKLIDVESLRYLYLDSFNSRKNSNLINLNHPIKLLVLCDYFPNNLIKQMMILKETSDFFSNKLFIIIKPHPANQALPIICNQFPYIKSINSIDYLLTECDIAYSGPTTSAAIDAYLSNIPIISVLDPNILNLSPLRGMKDVNFIRNSNELIASISNYICKSQLLLTKNSYFIIDKNLPRWRKIIKDNIS